MDRKTIAGKKGMEPAAEHALDDVIDKYFNSGRIDLDLYELNAEKRLQAVTRLLPYCLQKNKDSSAADTTGATGLDSLTSFFTRMESP